MTADGTWMMVFETGDVVPIDATSEEYDKWREMMPLATSVDGKIQMMWRDRGPTDQTFLHNHIANGIVRTRWWYPKQPTNVRGPVMFTHFDRDASGLPLPLAQDSVALLNVYISLVNELLKKDDHAGLSVVEIP
jgi:hypothetical protein